MQDVEFRYRLISDGSARVGFRIGREMTELAVSHGDEPLDRLIEAVLATASGEVRAEVFWRAVDDGRQWYSHFVWEFDREHDNVHVRVFKVRRGGGGQQGGTQLTGSCPVMTLCGAVAEGAQDLYLRTGLRAYAMATGSPFPVDGVDRLEALTSRWLS